MKKAKSVLVGILLLGGISVVGCQSSEAPVEGDQKVKSEIKVDVNKEMSEDKNISEEPKKEVEVKESEAIKNEKPKEETVTYYCSECGKAIVLNANQDAVDICNDCINKSEEQDPLVFTGCTNCYAKDHRAIDCPYLEEVCDYCGEVGHNEDECDAKAYDEELDDEWECPVCGCVNIGQGLCSNCGN